MGARIVIGEGESKHDGQPEYGADDHELGALGAVTCVHEVKNDEGGLDGRDAERDDNVEFAEILKCRPHGDGGADHQRQEN